MIETLTDVVDTGGYLSKAQVQAIAAVAPGMELVIVPSALRRLKVPACQVAAHVERIEAMPDDYVRSVFIPADNLPAVRAFLKIAVWQD